MAIADRVTLVPHQVRGRAVVKTLLYRVFMMLITIGVAWVVTGSIAAAVNIGILTNVMKTVTYYLYERLWDHVTWGVRGPEPT